MAQVRKYSKGNKVIKAEKGEPVLFTWDGYGDYNVADLEKTYAQNAENYIKSLGLNDEDSKKVLDRSYAILQAMKNGQIKNRNARGQWTNVPVGFESTGINEKDREKWWKKKDYVRDTDFYNNLGYNIMDKVLKGTSTYIKPTKVTNKSTFDTDFDNYLNKYYFYGKGFNSDAWDYNNAIPNIAARLSDWRKEVEASDLDDKTKSDLLSRIDAGLAGLQSETTDDDYAALARLGFNARQWIDKDYTSATSTEQPLTEEQKQQQETAKNYKEYLEANRNAGDSYYFSQQLLRPNFDPSGYEKIVDYSKANPVIWSEWNNDSDKQTFSNNFWAFFDQDRIKDLENQGFYENGYYYIPQSVNEAEGSIFRFNRNTNNIEKVPLSTFKKGVEKLEYLFGIAAGTKKPWEYKEGGIIKAQQGWYVDNTASIRARRERERSQEKQSSSSNNTSKPKSSRRIGTDDEWTTADIANLVSIGLDIASAGSAYVPVYGTVASATTGVGSSISNLVANISRDGADWGDAGSFVADLGLDALGLVPGIGTGAKAGKIAKAIVPLVPKLKNLVGLAGLGIAGNNIINVLNNIEQGKGVTMEDLASLTPIFNAIVTKRNVGKGINDALESGSLLKKYSVDLPTGETVNLNEDTYKKLITASTKESQEAILKEAGFDIKLDKKIGNAFTNWVRGKFKAPTYIATSKDKIEGGRWSSEDWARRVYSENYKDVISKSKKSTSKPEANVGSNKVINDVNRATEEWWKQHGQQVNTVADDIIQVMRDAHLWKDTPNRLALPRKSIGPEIPSSSVYPMPEKNVKNSRLMYNPRTRQWETMIYKKGGILRAQQGTTLRDVASTANWANQIYGTNAYFNWLKSFNTNNYQDFNNYQKGWNTNYLASNYNPTGINKTGNIAYSQNVWDSQGIFNKQANGVNQVIENLANTGVITRRGNSGDNAARNFQDGYFGGQEYLRHGGMESMLTPEQVAEINKNVNPQGLEYYFDPTTKMGFLRPMQQATKSTSFDPLAGLPQSEEEIPELQGTTSQQIIDELTRTNRTGEPGRLDINKSIRTKPQINWGDVLGTARLAGTIWTNNRIAKGLKESLSPLLLDPVQLRRQVIGDLVTRNYMENLGAEANRIGARPITSDASLQLGQQLDYNNRANEYRIKGYLADKQAIDKTTAEAQKVADFNKQQRVDVANRNRAAMLGIRQAKANIEAQRKSANWAQAIAPWLMYKEIRVRENQKLNQSLDNQENQYLYGEQYEQAIKNAQNIIDSAKNSYLAANNNDDTGWLTSDAYKQARKNYDDVVSQAAKTYRDNILKARKQSYNYNPFLFTFKSGGQLSYKEKSLLQRVDAVNKSFLNDRKLFHKMIADSQKENNKLIMSLGGLTKELIIKSMTYAG